MVRYLGSYHGLVRDDYMVNQYLVIGFKDQNSEGEPVLVRPFLRSNDTGVIHYADDTDELQERLEHLGDLRKYEKVIIQATNEDAGEADAVGPRSEADNDSGG